MTLIMLHRQGCHAFRVYSSRVALITTKAPSTTRQKSTRFSVEAPSAKATDQILQSLQSRDRLGANEDQNDAAVVLATPDQARNLTDDVFMANLARTLAGPKYKGKFHILAAAVDHITGPVGSYQPFRGFSILQGRVDKILPKLWEHPPAKSSEDADKPSALMFSLGRATVTVPTANTAFQNQKDFTLIASLYDLSGDSAQLRTQFEKPSQRVRIPLSRRIESTKDLGLWTPMLPVTHARAVTASFGNIIKGVEVDGASVPASAELERAVEMVFKQKPDLAESGPIGIWALVMPKDVYEEFGPPPVLDGSQSGQPLVDSTAQTIEKLCARGAKLYQILSGGGGWGPKKGLLSLDPQRGHFAPSEEASLLRFMNSMEGSDFAPIGSYIQFYTPLSPQADTSPKTSRLPAVIFGVHDQRLPFYQQSHFTTHHGLFGALSDSGIFTSAVEVAKGAAEKAATPTVEADDSKLSMPNSRVFFMEAEMSKRGWSQKHENDSTLLFLPGFYGDAGLGETGLAELGEARVGGVEGVEGASGGDLSGGFDIDFF